MEDLVIFRLDSGSSVQGFSLSPGILTKCSNVLRGDGHWVLRLGLCVLALKASCKRSLWSSCGVIPAAHPGVLLSLQLSCLHFVSSLSGPQALPGIRKRDFSETEADIPSPGPTLLYSYFSAVNERWYDCPLSLGSQPPGLLLLFTTPNTTWWGREPVSISLTWGKKGKGKLLNWKAKNLLPLVLQSDFPLRQWWIIASCRSWREAPGACGEIDWKENTWLNILPTLLAWHSSDYRYYSSGFMYRAEFSSHVLHKRHEIAQGCFISLISPGFLVGNYGPEVWTHFSSLVIKTTLKYIL